MLKMTAYIQPLGSSIQTYTLTSSTCKFDSFFPKASLLFRVGGIGTLYYVAMLNEELNQTLIESITDNGNSYSKSIKCANCASPPANLKCEDNTLAIPYTDTIREYYCNCGPGSWLSRDQGICISCPIGTFNQYYAQTSSSSCQQCAPGSYSDQIGANACTMCPKGTYSQIIAAISIFNCTPCDYGTYSDSEGSTVCTKCPNGYANSMNGSKSIGDCLMCLPGTFDGATGFCIDCHTGTYNDMFGQIACFNCPPGTANSNTKSNSSSKCVPCPAGTYSNPGSASCTSCPQGSYSDAMNSSSCTACPPGTYNANNYCFSCPADTYSSKSGQIQCEKCPINFLPSQSKNLCLSIQCHPFCINCTGTTDSDCVQCNETIPNVIQTGGKCICNIGYKEIYINQSLICQGI